MIGVARFQNFKALKDVEITFDSRLTVLVGPNGSGKSSVLRGIHLLCQLTKAASSQQNLSILAGSTYEWHGGGDETLLLEVHEGKANHKGLRMETHPVDVNRDGDRTSPLNYKMAWIGKDGQWVGAESNLRSVSTFADQHYTSQLVFLNPSDLSQSTCTMANPPEFNARGAGLASLLAYFKLFDESKFEVIQHLFRQLIPQVRGIRIDKVRTDGGNGVFGEALLFDLAERKGVSAAAMSDGTLYALGLIVKILDPQRPRVLLIDDIEHGFHPKAQLQLVEMLHKLLEEIPDLQIIATTHSPFVLDRLQWNEVRVTSLTDDGSVMIKSIEDHPQIDRWKKDMTPGEFWATFYESWVTQQQPSPLPV